MSDRKRYSVEAIVAAIFAAFVFFFNNLESTKSLLVRWKSYGGLPAMISDLLTNQVFLMLIVGVCLYLAIKAIRTSSISSETGNTPRAVATHLRLEYPSSIAGVPVAIQTDNIFRWFSLKYISVNKKTPKSAPQEQTIFTTVFVVFDTPVAIKQVHVDGVGALPMHEVKQHSPRHAIVVFTGQLANVVIDIRVI